MRGEPLTSIEKEKGAHFYCVIHFFLVEKRIKRAALPSPSFFVEDTVRVQSRVGRDRVVDYIYVSIVNGIYKSAFFVPF